MEMVSAAAIGANGEREHRARGTVLRQPQQNMLYRSRDSATRAAASSFFFAASTFG